MQPTPTLEIRKILFYASETYGYTLTVSVVRVPTWRCSTLDKLNNKRSNKLAHGYKYRFFSSDKPIITISPVPLSHKVQWGVWNNPLRLRQFIKYQMHLVLSFLAIIKIDLELLHRIYLGISSLLSKHRCTYLAWSLYCLYYAVACKYLPTCTHCLLWNTI